MLHLSLPITVGSTRNSLLVELVSALDGTPIPNQVAAGVTVTYVLWQDNTRTPTLGDLPSPKGPHAPNGWIALSPTRLPGLYRLDLPDAVFVRDGRSDFFLVGVLVAGAVPYYAQIPLREQDSAGDQSAARGKL